MTAQWLFTVVNKSVTKELNKRSRIQAASRGFNQLLFLLSSSYCRFVVVDYITLTSRALNFFSFSPTTSTTTTTMSSSASPSPAPTVPYVVHSYIAAKKTGHLEKFAALPR